MESNRKRLKVEDESFNSANGTVPDSPGDAIVQVPASSPVAPFANASPKIPQSPANTNGKRPGSAMAPSSEDEPAYQIKHTVVHGSNGAAVVNGVPNAPNMALRKAGFPSQQRMQTQVQAQAPVRTTSQTSNSPSPSPYSPANYQNGIPSPSLQMRQHVQNYQYNPNAVPAQGQMRAPQGYSQGAAPVQYVAYPQGQSPQQFYQNGSYQMTPQQMQQYQQAQQARMANVADQYAPNRPMQRLVQRPDPNAPGQFVQQQPYPRYQQMPPQGYASNMGMSNQYYPGPGQYARAGGYVQPQQQKPQVHIDPAAAAKLSEVFPHLPDAIIRKALIQARGHAEDAQSLLADDRVSFDLTDSAATPQPIYQVPHGYHPHMNGGMQQPPRQLPISTKRDLKAPNLSVREKQALRTAQTYPGQFHPHQQQQPNYPNPYMYQQQHQAQQQRQLQMLRMQQYQKAQQRVHVPAVYEAPKLRTRSAKKGPKIELGSDESEDDAVVELDSEGQDESEGDSEDDDQDVEVGVYLDFDRVALESRVLYFLNTVETPKEMADVASCTEDMAKFIIEQRPFDNLETVRALDQMPEGKRPSRTRKTIGTKVVDSSIDAMEGYEAIDSLVDKCTEYGVKVKEAIAEWGIDVDKVDDKDGAIDVVKVDAEAAAAKDSAVAYLKDQPSLLPEDVRLKDYQLFGVNWLHLMYNKKLSGILADEMGLGKTCQVISFLGVLLEKGLSGPHLVVVPASTLENWLREISRFCPSLKVEAYYGSQRERAEFRDAFEGEKRDFNIMVTTYQLATGAKDDRSFLKRQPFDVCVYDEGHNLKNSASSRYKYLMAIKANFRVLLTGTPLQNNLKELISLLAFVLPKVFAGNMERLDSIFKIKAIGDTESMESALLSQQRIQRAKTMMTPFILRRYKKDVLDDLPAKKYQIDYVELTGLQKEIYNEQLGQTRKSLDAKAVDGELVPKDMKTAINTMMQLRKCANHPMLFRKRYDDRMLKKIARNILKEDTFKDSVENLVIEDLEVMTDFEINRLCLRYPKINQYALEDEPWMDACKVQHLTTVLPEMQKNGDRVLLFSQFTQTLDILEDVLNTMKIAFFRLDGSTDVSSRQDMIDQFHEETDVTVFLLSTKAGGFGINLACANVVIIYDSSFNPHDDKQAEDRAHRVGQKREVRIIRIVAKNTIEEHIVRLANTKLTLDLSVSGDIDAMNKALEETGEKKVATTLLSQLALQ